jgi:transcriptional regulator with XRE-family HTH domain
MLPFGQTVLWWRLERGLTQDQLARLARIPRPNLSAIERGSREVTLKTVRALALALNITPGTLVDGAVLSLKKKFSRKGLERITDAIVRGKKLSSPIENNLVLRMRDLMRSQLKLQGLKVQRARRLGRSASYAQLRITEYPPDVIRTIIDRVRERVALVRP